MIQRGRLGVLLLGLLYTGLARAQEGGALPEYTVKAGFLFNFAKYVEWPAEAFEKADAPITIGIVGTDPFSGELEKALKGKTVKDRPFSIVRFPGPRDLMKVHILFVPRTERAHLVDILKSTEAWPVLTVGEDEGFARSGGTVNILIEREKPKLEVNPGAAEKARLTINSKLLKLATIVRTSR